MQPTQQPDSPKNKRTAAQAQLEDHHSTDKDARIDVASFAQEHNCTHIDPTLLETLIKHGRRMDLLHNQTKAHLRSLPYHIILAILEFIQVYVGGFHELAQVIGTFKFDSTRKPFLLFRSIGLLQMIPSA